MQLRITDLSISVSLGVYAWEKRRKRKIIVNLIVDYKPRGRADALGTTLDYDALIQSVREVAQARHYNLVETMVAAVGRAVLKFPQAACARVEISKPGAVPGANIAIAEEFGR